MHIVTLKKARAAGLAKYFTGKPCIRGHVADRYVKGRACVECAPLRTAEWKANNPERARAVRRAGHYRNKEKRNAYSRDYVRRNRERLVAYNRAWCAANPEKFNRLSNLLRTRLRVALKGNHKAGSAVRDLGCSIEQFKDYIKARFVDGMTWDNHGIAWELDHIKPLASFDLADRKQFLEACHYTNIQPLFIEEHKMKTRIEFSQRFLRS